MITENDPIFEFVEHLEPSTEQQKREKLLEGLTTSFGLVLLSEIGDKTFLFIAVYATRMVWPKLLLISCIAMFTMHVSGVLVGGVFQFVVSAMYLKIISSIMFLGFGISFIYEAYTEEDDEENLDEKYKEVEKEVSTNEKKKRKASDEIKPEDGRCDVNESVGLIKRIFMNHSVTVILMIIAEEIGDRSQITAIALAATYDFWVITLGGILGHFIAVCIAITLGKVISHYLNEKMMNYAGGVCFLSFGVYGICSLLS